MSMHGNARMTPIGRERLVQVVVGWQTRRTSRRRLPANGLQMGARFKPERRAGFTMPEAIDWRNPQHRWRQPQSAG